MPDANAQGAVWDMCGLGPDEAFALGHVVTAPAAESLPLVYVVAWVVTAVLVAGGLGVTLWGVARWFIQHGWGAFLRRLRVILMPVFVGLTLASVILTGLLDEVGSASSEAMHASFRVIPAALDVGARCAAARPSEASVPSEGPIGLVYPDGCQVHGALAAWTYPAMGLDLVLSEMRLARPGATVDCAARQRGLRLASAERRWGLVHAPFTAQLMGTADTARPTSSRRLSTTVLFFILFGMGFMGWVYFRRLLPGSESVAGDPGGERRRQARLKDLSLYAVLGVGVYLSFAALTALGPFLEARRLAEDGSAESAQSRLEAVESEWSAHAVTLVLPSDDDLTNLEAALARSRNLRHQSLENGFFALKPGHQEMLAALRDTRTAASNLAQPPTPLPPLPIPEAAAADGAAVAAPAAQREPRVAPEVRLAARALTAALADARDSLEDFTALKADKPGDSAAEQARVAWLQVLDQHRTLVAQAVATLQAELVTAGAPAIDALLPAQVTRPLDAFETAVMEATADYEARNAIIEREVRAMGAQIAGYRSLRWDLRSAPDQLGRTLQQGRRVAREALRSAQSEFGAVQRAGPSWLDRQEALAGWYVGAFSDAVGQTEQCAAEVSDTFAQNRSMVGLALDTLPDDAAPANDAQLPRRLEQFRASISEPPAMPLCVDATAPRASVPDRLDTNDRYGATVGLLSGWLLQSGTVDLVLIAGMLGFGLLGAGLSRVVRRHLDPELQPTGRDRSEEPIIEDVPSVVFQGLGATLIIYLAGVGGLGAISSSVPDLELEATPPAAQPPAAPLDPTEAPEPPEPSEPPVASAPPVDPP